ncbi:MAG TPA: hypothetical protein VGF17_26330 [Phytomonospora sp.]
MSRSGKESRPLRLTYGWHVLSWLCTGIVVSAAVAVLLWIAFGRPDLSGPVEPGQRFDVVKLILTVAGSVAGGVGAVVALVVSYRKQHQSEAAERREDTRLFNERYHQAAEQLGSERAAVRLAGVYALAGLADDWDDGRRKCVEVLCAYMRMPYAPPDPALSDEDEDVEVRREQRRRREEREVRRAVLDTIGERLRAEPGEGSWHRLDFDFRGAVIDGGNLREAKIIAGTVLRFDEAVFRDGMVSFTGTVMTGGFIGFTMATFARDGVVEFIGAAVSGGIVLVDGARMNGGRLLFGEGAAGSALVVQNLTGRHKDRLVRPGSASASSPPAPREPAE